MSNTSEIHLQIEPGGCLELDYPKTEAECSTCFSMAFGLSVALGAAVVKVAHWLPALHLYIQVAPEMVKAQAVPVAKVWPDVGQAMQQWMASPSDGGALVFDAPWGCCVLAPDIYTWPSNAVEFTLECRWPGSVQR